jgi:hypothetical protein
MIPSLYNLSDIDKFAINPSIAICPTEPNVGKEEINIELGDIVLESRKINLILL